MRAAGSTQHAGRADDGDVGAADNIVPSYGTRRRRRRAPPPPPPSFEARIVRDPSGSGPYGPVIRNEVTATKIHGSWFYGLFAAMHNQGRNPLKFPAASIGIGIGGRRATMLLYATGCCVSTGTTGGEMRIATWMAFKLFMYHSHRARLLAINGYQVHGDDDNIEEANIRITNLVFSGQVGQIDPVRFYFSNVVLYTYNPQSFPAVECTFPGIAMHGMVHPSGATLLTGCLSKEQACQGYAELHAIAALHRPLSEVSKYGGVRNAMRIHDFRNQTRLRANAIAALAGSTTLQVPPKAKRRKVVETTPAPLPGK